MCQLQKKGGRVRGLFASAAAAAARVAIHIRKIFSCLNAAARLINHLAKCARGVRRLGVAVPKTPRLPTAACRSPAARQSDAHEGAASASSVKRGSYSFANFCSHCWR